jgi:hypothetical protein
MFMITSGAWLTPTRASGLAAYGTAVACCGIAWFKANNRRKDLRLAAPLTVIEGALLLDIIFNWRWMLHDLAAVLAQRAHDYDFRGPPQELLDALLLILLLFGWVSVFRKFSGRIGPLLAVSGVLLSLVLWCVEVVSLHAVDSILYHLAGKVMVVGLLWILAAIMVSVGILIDSRKLEAG